MRTQLCNSIKPLFTRRDVLQQTACGFGWLALAGIAGQAQAAPGPLDPKAPPLPARAKRVIFLCAKGGPSQVDTFDYKPKLKQDDGKPAPKQGAKLLGSKWKFAQHGQSGLWITELFPHLAKHADKLCIIPSMQTDLPAHAQAYIKLHTGNSQFVRPSLGAWSLYGLGTENQNLPGFISITPPNSFGGSTNYGSAFLPAIYQGTRIGDYGRPFAGSEISNLRPRSSSAEQRAEIDFIQSLNRDKAGRDRFNPEVEGMIESLELAFRMQKDMPGAMDLSRETEETKKLYGLSEERTADMGRKLLITRRLIEAGVRFVEVTHGNWDHHSKINPGLETCCGESDRPIAGLLTDLAGRGLLKDTLVIWAGEFGRTPYAEGADGRDHNMNAFTIWMAGGGVKGGFTFGRSDDYGYETVENPIPIVDLHATLLALMGLDHEKLTFRHAGRDFRLTDVKGRVVNDIFA